VSGGSVRLLTQVKREDQMRGIRAACVAVAVVLLTSASPAKAVDFFGYFRDSYGGNNKGGGQACYKTPGMDYKLRLGNECDNYGEWGLQQSVYKDQSGVDFTVGVMFDYDSPSGTSPGTSTPFGIQQNYVKMKVPQWAGAQFWAGKQYYRRENIDMIDFFYLNTSDTGIGVEDVDLGWGKLAFSVFGITPPKSATGALANPGGFDVAFFRPDLRLYGIKVNPGGTLEVDGNVMSISRNKTVAPAPANEGSTSFWLTLEHVQSGVLGGSNTFAAQYANGANAAMGPGTPGFGDEPTNKNNMQIRVLDQLLLQPSNVFQVLVGGMYQYKEFGESVGNKRKFNQYGIFTRPVWYVSDYFKLQGDLGYTSNKESGQSGMNLLKGTIAPTLTPMVGSGGGFFVRPEIRLFVTFASWNDAAAAASPTSQNGVAYGTDKSGVSYGMSVETWF
jgi:maltoporin